MYIAAVISRIYYLILVLCFYREVNGNGKTLVICCEGNAGFYEIGMAGTPLAEGYSVLGWNHPGFGGSSVSIKNKLSVFLIMYQKSRIETGFEP